jgi:hypothetical protein
MPNWEHHDRFRAGVERWNEWRQAEPETIPDLSYANLGHSGVNFSYVNLSNANLRRVVLAYQNLSGADFRGAHCNTANLIGADLRNAILREADLSGANLTGADLKGADLSAANLSSARLQSAILNQATITGARFWETQLAGWSIKNIICERAFWDNDGSNPTDYAPGEFERLHSETPRIELFYEGGITTFELNTLPALLSHLASLHSNCTIRLNLWRKPAAVPKYRSAWRQWL